jgi:hypothetical protein
VEDVEKVSQTEDQDDRLSAPPDGAEGHVNEQIVEGVDDQTTVATISPPITEPPIAEVSSDPALWKSLSFSSSQRSAIISMGTPTHPKVFPTDGEQRKFPVSIFCERLHNGEKVKRDWLVWSESAAALMCFPCSLFGSANGFGTGNNSLLLAWNGEVKGNWRKLPSRTKAHQSSGNHRKHYLEWKTLLLNVQRHTGVDAELEKASATKLQNGRKSLVVYWT